MLVTPVLHARHSGLQAPTGSRGWGASLVRPLRPQGPSDTQGSASRLPLEPSDTECRGEDGPGTPVPS